jgi:sialate O-acetylesterase
MPGAGVISHLLLCKPRLLPKFIAGLAVATVSTSSLEADVRLPALFSSNMVLQRDMNVPVWGWADPDESVTVTLGSHHIATTAGKVGRWSVKLPPLQVPPAGQSYELTVVGKNTIRLSNVTVGEVWICAGQSNMEMPLGTIGTAWGKGIYNSELEVAGARYPDIRLFTVWKHTPLAPQEDCQGSWSECSPETAYSFPAPAYFFGRRLHKELNLPIGLIHIAYAGVSVESCVRPQILRTIAGYTPYIPGSDARAEEWAKQQDSYERELADWTARLAANTEKDNLPGWAELDYDDSDWHSLDCSEVDSSAKLAKGARPLCLRKRIKVPIYWGGRDLILRLPAAAGEAAYFNGVKLRLVANDDHGAKFQVPAAVVRPGDNVVAFRGDKIDVAGWSEGENQVGWLELSTGPDAPPISLAGVWRYRAGDAIDPALARPEPPPDYYPPLDSSVYDGMVAPLIPFGFRGVIWYQGEANVECGYEYRDLFSTMIRDWRDQWREGDFPFYFVQIANSAFPVADAAAELRESQSLAMRLPHTGMVVTLDIGEDGGHPRNKLDVGERLALWALNKDYGRPQMPSGPLYTSMDVAGRQIRLHFDYTGAGLTCHGATLGDFVIAGSDKVFHDAHAAIDHDTVVVQSDDVAEPIAVRYAWSNVVPQLSLFNRDGLPAPPFRTDDWPGATFGKTTPGWWKKQ